MRLHYKTVSTTHQCLSGPARCPPSNFRCKMPPLHPRRFSSACLITSGASRSPTSCTAPPCPCSRTPPCWVGSIQVNFNSMLGFRKTKPQAHNLLAINSPAIYETCLHVGVSLKKNNKKINLDQVDRYKYSKTSS